MDSDHSTLPEPRPVKAGSIDTRLGPCILLGAISWLFLFALYQLLSG